MKKLIYLMVVIAVLGLIVSGCSIPLKSVVPTSEKGNPKPELGTPTLEKITFIHYVKPTTNSKPVWDDTVDIYKFMFGGIKWAATMQYEVNTAGSDLDDNDVMAALSASLETWDTETSFELFDDELGVTKRKFNSGDRINRVTWGGLPWENAIAMCVFWFNPATKEIVESDVVFSTNFDWSVDGVSGTMDLQNIATHEFGHNGLNDLYMPPSTALTMYGYGDYGETKKRDLGIGDILGIQELYGPPLP